MHAAAEVARHTAHHVDGVVVHVCRRIEGGHGAARAADEAHRHRRRLPLLLVAALGAPLLLRRVLILPLLLRRVGPLLLPRLLVGWILPLLLRWVPLGLWLVIEAGFCRLYGACSTSNSGPGAVSWLASTPSCVQARLCSTAPVLACHVWLCSESCVLKLLVAPGLAVKQTSAAQLRSQDEAVEHCLSAVEPRSRCCLSKVRSSDLRCQEHSLST